MKTNTLNELKEPLMNGEFIELVNEDDLALLTFRKGAFLFTLNGKILFAQKRFKSFIDKVSKIASQNNLQILESV